MPGVPIVAVPTACKNQATRMATVRFLTLMVWQALTIGQSILPATCRIAVWRFHAGVYVLDFLRCLRGLAATATARLVRSLSQFLRSFCCLVTMGAVILRLLGMGAFMTFMRCPP